jgi:hypothetical protein
MLFGASGSFASSVTTAAALNYRRVEMLTNAPQFVIFRRPPQQNDYAATKRALISKKPQPGSSGPHFGRKKAKSATCQKCLARSWEQQRAINMTGLECFFQSCAPALTHRLFIDGWKWKSLDLCNKSVGS